MLSYMKRSQIKYSVCFAALMISQSQASASVLEEIVVTAQKREQNIQDVSIAITALTGEDIRKLGFTESMQVITMSPGVSRSGSSGEQTAQFSIRGVTQNDFSDHVEAPNAVYVDEGYIGFSQAQVFGLFDLERVEVLKGPQGTLFGRNATGGLVHFITKKPSKEVEGFMDATYGSFNQIRLEGAIGGAISDNMSGRLSVFFNDFDPILKNQFPFGLPEGLSGSPAGATDFYSDHQWAVRGQLLIEFNESSDLLVSAYASEKTPSSGNFQNLATTAVVNDAGGQVNAILSANDPLGCSSISATTGACVGGTRPVQGGDYFGYIDPDGPGRLTSADFASEDFNEYKTQGSTAKLNWNFDNMTLTAVSHFMHSTKQQALDTDSGPAPATIVMNDSKNDTFSQEVRLSGETNGMNWVAGVYYLHIDTIYNQGLSDTDGGINIFGNGTPALEADFKADLVTNSYSAFGQVDIPLGDQLTLVIGARMIQEKKEYEFTSFIFENIDDMVVDNRGVPIGPFLPGFLGGTSDFLWAGKVQLEYRPNEDTLIYGGVNRGVKAGSFNAPLLDVLTEEQFSYDEEVLISYEAGFKISLSDGKARINGSIYYYDYDDYQAFSFTGLTGAIFNKDATFKGGELEVQMFPTDALSILFGASYIDATINNLAVAPDVFRDVRPAFTPEVQFNVMAIYEIPVEVFGGHISLQAEGNYTSSFFQTIKNFDAQKTDEYFIGNARVSWINQDESVELAAFVKNITDVDNKVTAIDLSGLCGCTEQSYGAPRWYGVQARFNF